MVPVAVEIEVLVVEARCHCHSHLAEEEVVEGTESHLHVFAEHYCYHYLDDGVRDLAGHLAVEEEEAGDLEVVLEVPAMMETEHYCRLSEGVKIGWVVVLQVVVEEDHLVGLVHHFHFHQSEGVGVAADCQAENGQVVFLVIEVVALQVWWKRGLFLPQLQKLG